MTNPSAAPQAPEKKKKAKGPIRFEAIIPTAIIIGLIWAYFALFFDGHLRRGLEYAATQVHGAEINIGAINTSFLRGSFEMLDLQVTDKEKPHRNIFQIGRMHFQFLWDALLRAKFVVSDASITNIQALAPRHKPGFVIPPTPKDESDESGVLDKVQDQVVEQTRKKFRDNFLGDIANLLGGVDPKDQLKNLEGELKSSLRIKELDKELKDKQAKWNQRIKELPQGAEIQAYSQRIKSLKFDSKNPIEFANNLKEAEKIIREVDQKVKLVEQSSKELNGDVNTYSQTLKDLEKMVEGDLKDMQSRLKIPDIDPKEFSTQLFLTMIQQRLGSALKYAQVARKYMPPKKTAEEKEANKLTAHERGKGKNFRFPITTGYPLFWLKHAAISSQAGNSEYGGDLKGSIKNMTSDPVYLGKPTIIEFAGNFPKPQIMDVAATITVDHTKENAPREAMVARVGAFPVSEYKLSDSNDVRFGLTKAVGVSQLNVELADSQITLDIKNQFKEISYAIDAKSRLVKDILTGVANDISLITMDAKAKGNLSSMDIDIDSNLGQALSQGFKKQIQAKVDEAKQKLRAMINDKIGGEKQKLTAEFDKLKSQLSKELDSKKGEIEKAKKTAQNQVDQEKNKAVGGDSKKLEQEGKKALKKLFGG